MKKIFIILDIMSTGNIPDVRDYLSKFSNPEYEITMVNHYFEHEMYAMGDFDHRFAIIDFPYITSRGILPQFETEIKLRTKKLHSLGFNIVFQDLWEAVEHTQNPSWAKGRTALGTNTTRTWGGIDYLLKDTDVSHYHILSASRTYFWQLMLNNYTKSWNAGLNHTEKPYDFFFLNKKPRHYRKYLYDLCINNGSLSNSLYTIWEKHRRIQLLDQYELPGYAKKYPDTGKDQQIYALPYEHTKISLVSETATNSPRSINGAGSNPLKILFMTEKIWKPILCTHPFIVFGQENFLIELKKMGFKTFDSVWDESYDTETDGYARAEKIAQLALSLQGCDAKKLYEDTKEIRAHNLKIFFNEEKLSQLITEDITNALFNAEYPVSMNATAQIF
jgi:hypothetical protein